MSKHTPGPWECEFRSMSLPVIRSGLERIAIVDSCGGDGLVNARLIAAAPDLADVAHMVLNTATVYTPPELVKAATEALRKAGEI